MISLSHCGHFQMSFRFGVGSKTISVPCGSVDCGQHYKHPPCAVCNMGSELVPTT
jgi:hypothetical protein